MTEEARFYTLGCKLNQLETESLADAFRREGFIIAAWNDPSNGPCVLIVNTCTVTSHAEQKARRIIRKALRGHPSGIVVVTGCYAQMEAQALTSAFSGPDAGRVFVVPGERKDGLLDLPAWLKQNPAASLAEALNRWTGLNRGGGNGVFRFRPVDYTFHSRAFIKIQDGCDNRCGFCRVNLARGRSRSRDSSEIFTDVKALEDKGCPEAVLTGVNISQYQGGLAGLLRLLLDETKTLRFRLSSLESAVFDPAFFDVITNTRIRPHFHLSLQSGSPSILEGMGRAGSLEVFAEAIGRLRSLRDDPFLACDIITGFPGETEACFEETLEFCRRIDFTWIHVFPFSPRPGTAACGYKNRVSESAARQRAEALNKLARRGKIEYVRRWTGRKTEFVPDIKGDSSRGYPPCPSGVTENYLKVVFPGAVLPIEAPPRCVITGESGRSRNRPFDAEADIIL